MRAVNQDPSVRNKTKLLELQGCLPGSNLMVVSRQIEVIMKDDTRKSFDEYRDEELFDLIAREAYTKNSDLIF